MQVLHFIVHFVKRKILYRWLLNSSYMSFGFSIGDFIAAGELVRLLYREFYLVAREAPEKLKLLMTEVGALSQSVDFLIDDV